MSYYTKNRWSMVGSRPKCLCFRVMYYWELEMEMCICSFNFWYLIVQNIKDMDECSTEALAQLSTRSRRIEEIFGSDYHAFNSWQNAPTSFFLLQPLDSMCPAHPQCALNAFCICTSFALNSKSLMRSAFSVLVMLSLCSAPVYVCWHRFPSLLIQTPKTLWETFWWKL